MSTDQESPIEPNETPPETDVPKTLKAPNPNATPPPKPPDDAETLKDPIATDTPPETDVPKTTKAPNADATPPPKPPDDAETLKDPIATGTPPETNNAKIIQDTKTNETPPPKADDPKTLEDSNTNETPTETNETPPPKPDNPITLKDSKTNETPAPKPDDAETLKDSNANEPPPPLETKSSSENHPTAEDVETIKQAPATDAGPHVQQAPPLENATTLKDSSSSSPSHPNYVSAQITTTHEPEIDENPNEISPAHDDKTTSKITSDRPKKPSFWNIPKIFCLNFLKKNSYSKPSPVVDKSTKNEKELVLPSKLKKAIQDDFEHTSKGATVINQYKDELEILLKELNDQPGPLGDDLHKLQHELIKLRLQITLKYKDADKGSFKNIHFTSKAKQAVPQEVLDMMPQLHKNPFFESSPEFKDFEARYEKLEPKLKLCLLCFSVFPENAIIKKRVMVQWWVSEGFASEEVANDYFIKLLKKGFIKPDKEDRSYIVGSCRMHPFYRSALVMLAERAKFLNFDSKGMPTQNFSGSFRACLVGQGLISYEDLKDGKVEVLDLEKVHLLININEAVLEFKKDWFSKMKNVNFLYLGRWEASAKHDREVDDTVFLEELKNMSYVKFLSLQGVSNMIDLPVSVLKLTNLEILDIRACHNLETIPKKIGLLKWLTHLDMSECYLLEHMPKDISSLEHLRVLKGFVVGNLTGKNKSCTLDDLKKLRKLVKLCIYTGLREFPDSQNVEALGNLTELRKLTISWGGNAFQPRKGEGQDVEKDGSEVEKDGPSKTGGLPQRLEKLDLRYFPTSKTPHWLKVQNLKGLSELKRLYIRAGKFSDIGQYQESDSWDWPVNKDVWKVEVLRLRYLPEIEMEWRQAQELFPDLVYLEQVGCPRLTLFPCDANGVWRRPK